MVIAASSTTSEVYDFLYNLFSTASYPLVTYDVTTRARQTGADQTPASLELNETSSGFETAMNRRTDFLDHKRWTWEVEVTFQREIDWTHLRELLQKVPHLNNTRIKVERAVYQHPPRQQASVGSKGTFLLNVLLHPV